MPSTSIALHAVNGVNKMHNWVRPKTSQSICRTMFMNNWPLRKNF